MLELLAERDVEALHALVAANRAHLAARFPWAAAETPAQTRDFVLDSLRRFERGEGFDLGIWHEGRLVGAIGLHETSAANRSTCLGYWLAEDARGKGIALRSARALVAFCFEVLGMHRVVIRVAPDNARSLALARRLGFREEGTLREAERMGEGWLDLVVLSMLEREWRS